MTVHASTHVESVSMCGWAPTRHRANLKSNHHVLSNLRSPNHHHLPNVFCPSNESQVAMLPDGNDSQGDSLVSPGALGAHLSLTQCEVES
jgi:hypothetical protein